MRRSTVFSAFVLALVVLLTVEGSAFANYTEPTSLSLRRRPGGRVDPGTGIRFLGRLSSDRPACRRFKVIKLIRVGDGVIDTDRTDRFGRYRFDRRVYRTRQFRTRFDGTRKGVHPNIKVCLASRSRTVTVRIRN
jgi:hypothetical protein